MPARSDRGRIIRMLYQEEEGGNITLEELIRFLDILTDEQMELYENLLI